MKSKNVTYLSLGSNLGSRKQNIEKAIQLIVEKIGEVRKKSRYYVSKAWGFQSNDLFLNNIIEIETHLAPLQLFSQIKIIEELVGRVYSLKEEGYESRVIDIDIIYYNNIIYSQKELKIPHLNMQNRKFVLEPLLEINSNIKHPILNKNTKTLLEECEDQNELNVYEK